MKKNHSQAAPLKACEVKCTGPRKGKRCSDRKSLGQVAFEKFYEIAIVLNPKVSFLSSFEKDEWEKAAQAVIEETIRRLEEEFSKPNRR